MSSTSTIKNDIKTDAPLEPEALSEAELAAICGGGLGDSLVKIATGVAAGVGVVATIALAPATAPAALLIGIGIVGGLATGVITGQGVVELFPEDQLPGPGYDVGPYEDYKIR